MPMIRKDGRLQEATWEQAFALLAQKLPGASLAGVIGDRVSNEDAFVFNRFVRGQNGTLSLSPALAAAYADIARAHGLPSGSDFKALGKGDVILVVNGDVEEQAPVWFLRLRQAVVDRGAKLIVAHSRSTKMHRYAAKIMRYEPAKIGEFVAASAEALGPELTAARNVVIVFGDEKLDAPSARALASHLANLLIDSGKAGKVNSGLLPLYPHANTQGVFDMIHGDNATQGQAPSVVWALGVGDAADIPKGNFLVVQDILNTELARQADVVLPALSFAERDGTYTSGDRRVQRFYRALPAQGQAKPDWWIVQEAARKLGAAWSYQSAAHVFADIANSVPHYAGLSSEALAAGAEQWPPMGRGDLYYGGTVYDNTGGQGVRYASDAEKADAAGAAQTRYTVGNIEPVIGALERPARRLYQDGELLRRSNVVQSHIVSPEMARA
jgi:NADH-quinone oxidoreductase subunit G